jgi:hypothetical protein
LKIFDFVRLHGMIFVTKNRILNGTSSEDKLLLVAWWLRRLLRPLRNRGLGERLAALLFAQSVVLLKFSYLSLVKNRDFQV